MQSLCRFLFVILKFSYHSSGRTMSSAKLSHQRLVRPGIIQHDRCLLLVTDPPRCVKLPLHEKQPGDRLHTSPVVQLIQLNQGQTALCCSYRSGHNGQQADQQTSSDIDRQHLPSRINMKEMRKATGSLGRNL